MQTFTYLKNLLADKYVASITPTSKYAVGKLCEKIDFNGGGQVFVEYGPGNGVFTFNLLRHMADHSRLIAIERNKNFCRLLKGHLQDPRVKLFNDCASNILEILKRCQADQADYILSGIPFSLLPPATRIEILQNTHSALKPGGKFLAYQTFFQPPQCLKVHLEEIFRQVSSRLIMLCVPPILIFEAIK